MTRSLRLETILGAMAWAAAGTLIAFGCSSTDEASLAVVPYHNVGARTQQQDASATQTSADQGGSDQGGSDQGGGGQGGNDQAGGGSPNSDCDPLFCPAVQFGSPCCTDTGECGVSIGGNCFNPGGDAGTSNNSGNSSFECTKPSDCSGGQICCGQYNGSGYDNVACADSCSGNNQFVFCTSDSDCSGGNTCQSSTVLTNGEQVCR